MGDLDRYLQLLGYSSPIASWAELVESIPALVSYFSNLLSGRPKLQDTQAVATAFGSDAWWPIRGLGANLGIWIRNGVPISTSNPTLQSQLSGWKHGTVLSIQTLAPAYLTNAYFINNLLNLAMTSQYGPHAQGVLDEVIAASVAQASVAPAVPKPTAVSSFCSLHPQICRDWNAILTALQKAAPQSVVNAAKRIEKWGMAHQTAAWVASYGICIALALAGNERLAGECLAKLILEYVTIEEEALANDARLLASWFKALVTTGSATGIALRPPGDPPVPRLIFNATAPTRFLNPTLQRGIAASIHAFKGCNTCNTCGAREEDFQEE